MIKDIKAEFAKNSDEYLKFDNITECKPYPVRDMCAFHLLHCLSPSHSDMIMGAEHDKIYLRVSPQKLAKIATPAQILYLQRCGVIYDYSSDCLTMFT